MATDPEIDLVLNASDEFAFEYLTEMEIPDGTEHQSVMFAIFIHSVHSMLAYGWTKEQLIQEIHTHEAIASSKGSIQ